MSEVVQTPATATPAAEQPVTAPPAAPQPEQPAAPQEQPTTPETQEDPKFAARFAALSKREASVRKQEQAVKELQAKFQSWEAEQKLFQENPLEFLNKKGISFDKLTQLALNDGKKPPEMQIKELEERIEREKREREELEIKKAEENRNRTRSNYIQNADTFVKAKAQDYEFLSAQDAPGELILEVVEQHYQRTTQMDEDGNVIKPGRILSLEEAVKLTEEGLEKEFESRFGKLNKVKSKFLPKEPAAPLAAEGKPVTKTPTLTNSQQTAVATPTSTPVKSIEESKREAAKLLKWV